MEAFKSAEAMGKKEWESICFLLEDHHSLFYKIWQLGKPFFTNSIETACVIFNKTGNYVGFYFNPVFWQKCSDYKKLFVISHEALHVLFNHGFRFKDCENKLISNMAMDVTVNHMLINQFGFIRDNIEGAEELCWVDTVFKEQKVNGFPISNDQTAEYYYNLILRQAKNESQKNKNGEGSDGKSSEKSTPKTLDDHSHMDESNDFSNAVNELNDLLTDEEKEGIEKLYKKHQKEIENGLQAGKGAGGKLIFPQKTIIKQKKKWETVIKKWTSKQMSCDDSPYDQWARKHRRFTLIDCENMFLPSEMDVENWSLNETKIDVYFYLDTSASCSHLADRFFAAAESLPKRRFNVNLFCFDTEIYGTTIKSRQLYGGGGTSFKIINDDIEKTNYKKYPTVFVMTDGYGDLVSPKKPENWYWFVDANKMTIENIKKNYLPENSNIFILSDFI